MELYLFTSLVGASSAPQHQLQCCWLVGWLTAKERENFTRGVQQNITRLTPPRSPRGLHFIRKLVSGQLGFDLVPLVTVGVSRSLSLLIPLT